MAGCLSTLVALQQVLLNCEFGFDPPSASALFGSLSHTHLHSVCTPLLSTLTSVMFLYHTVSPRSHFTFIFGISLN